MKKIIAISAIAAMTATTTFASEDLAAQLEALKAQIKKLEAQVQKNESAVQKVNKVVKKNKKNITANKILANNDNIKWDVDFRTAIDYISYKRADGTKTQNRDIMTNKLNLGMGYAPSDNMIFKGKLAYSKAFGANPPSTGATTAFPQRGMSFDTFDWVANETYSSDKLSVKEAYWLYMNDTFLGTDVSWTASIGRRPSTNGFLVNLREDDKPQSPIGHAINVEFDGASFKFNLDKVTGVDGMYWKLCLGRGLTNALPRFDMSGGLTSNGDYSDSASTMDDIDMKGFIFVPYNDGQYSVETTYYQGTNLPGFGMANGTVTNNGDGTFSVSGDGMVSGIQGNWNSGTGQFLGMSATSMNTTSLTMKSLGDLTGAAISFKADGIGDGISDFLDETTFFASWAQSKTSPANNVNALNLNAFNGFIGATATQIDAALVAMGMTTAEDGTGDGINTAAEQNDLATNMAAAASGMTAPVGMLGSTEAQTGHSVYIGAQVPCPLTEDGRIGVEWNKGSKYWRSMTYAEDTLAGSKLATRGTAWEIYYNKPLLPELSMQLRYTKMKYDYTGSQGFFGAEGTPMTMAEAQGFGMNPIEEATDIRAYLRYRF
jgi:hypothetical protein